MKIDDPVLCNRIRRILSQALDGKDSDDETISDTAPYAAGFLRHVQPVAQNGPQCGIVALEMAGDIFTTPCAPVSTQEIFEEAKRMGITNNGEIFSVQWLADLATRVYPSHKASVVQIDQLPNVRLFILESLIASKAILVPYDTDKNFEPCSKDGRTAHWALIVGFMVIDSRGLVSVEDLEQPYCGDCMCFRPDLDRKRIFWLPYPVTSCVYDGFKNYCVLGDILKNLDNPSIKTFLFAIQGKSKHIGVWPLEQVLESNLNLRQVGQNRLNGDVQYKIPDEGVSGGLGGKILVIE